METIEKNYVIGLDLGGTNSVFGIVDARGEIKATTAIKTKGYPDPKDYVAASVAALEPIIDSVGGIERIKGMGIGAPNGNYYTGQVEEAPNLDWKGSVPLAKLFEEKLGIPVALTNDANAAAMGEMTYGVARGMKNFIMITLGTGVGSGIVVDGKLVHGSTGAAGELGHAILIPHGRKCSCGREGCLETYTSARGIVQTYIELRREDPDGERMLKEVPDGEISSKLIGEAAHQGDPVALKTWAIVGDQLGLAMANSVTFSAPEAIFLMGGPAQVGEPLLRPLREAFERYLLNIFAGTCQIRMSELKANEVAILGAAALLKMKS